MPTRPSPTRSRARAGSGTRLPSPGGACTRQLVALQLVARATREGRPFVFPHERSDAQLEKVQERLEAPPERERSSRASTRRNDAVALTAAFACALSERGRAPGSKAPPDVGRSVGEWLGKHH